MSISFLDTPEKIESRIDDLTMLFHNEMAKLNKFMRLIDSPWRIKTIDHFANICNEIDKIEHRIELNKIECAILCRKHKELTNTLVN